MDETEQISDVESPKSTSVQENGIPVPKDHLQLNQAEANQWISQEPDEKFKQMKQKMVDNLKIVPQEEFRASLDKEVKKLDALLQGKQYTVLWDNKPHSSKRWVYEQAKTSLSTPPATETYFGNYDVMEEYETFRTEVLDKGIDTFVVMDDAVYSGKQFRESTLKRLIEVYKNFGYYPPRMPNVILVAPYMTNDFRNNEATKTAQEQGIVTLVNENTMPTLREIFTEDEKVSLQQRENKLDLPEQTKTREQFDPLDEDVVLEATLTAFDHRIADAHSFCEPFAHRLGLSASKPYGDTETPYYKKEDEEFKAYQAKRLQRASELRAKKNAPN
jgi:hypothetical protein